MNMKEFEGDLFSAAGRPGTMLCHCISADFADTNLDIEIYAVKK